LPEIIPCFKYNVDVVARFSVFKDEPERQLLRVLKCEEPSHVSNWAPWHEMKRGFGEENATLMQKEGGTHHDILALWWVEKNRRVERVQEGLEVGRPQSFLHHRDPPILWHCLGFDVARKLDELV
jgi:hypothetical protein